MISDLTTLFHEAKRRQPLWTPEKRIRAVNQILASITGSVDIRDNEDWHWITVGKEVVAYIRLDLPLAFVYEKYADMLRSKPELEAVVMIPVKNWNSPEYSLDPSSVDLFFPGERWKSDSVSPTQFAVNDLVYVTI
jgi:hypothetical protein